ncbi:MULTISPECIES: GH36-type glycosyl hydrolase domain-containing protein [Pseudobutyrivibrio]|uniref:Glycosyltransferase family 36 n=1 Tax=Pseudobutyrivibrio xylanivorans TaxID=185007 RepID=A0A1G5RWL6_PSEXY|nr:MULTISPECIES: cellobiose phosphorylase [Pseudobutyrivibrio]MDC7278578.1 cellobiose phosphorylase [Butyrivibrio fibrisolvens]SCZ77841.1 Glycosyltransferase family 36 [Pseudobutyrivibrio xylanivorans]
MLKTINTDKFEFLDDKGSFKIGRAEDTSYLYFPIAGEKGLKSSVTPNLGGDAMVNQETFLLEPVSVENLHNNKNGRNFWLYMDNGSVWSAVGTSAEQESKKFTMEQDESLVSAGFMWHTATRANSSFGVLAEITSFVPVDLNVEVMSVTIKNISDQTKVITPIAAIPIFGRSADNLRDHRNVTSMLHRISTIDEGVTVKPTMSFDEKGHRLNNKTYFVIGFDENGKKPESFFPTVESFIGEGGSFSKPRSVYRQESGCGAGENFAGLEAVGGLKFAKATLAPKEEIVYTVLIGVAEDEAELEAAKKKLASKDDVEKALEATKKYWSDKVNVSFHTGNKEFDQFMAWVAFQPFLRRVYGCSFLPYHDYGRGGRGWRDLWQDCLALLFMEPDDVRKMLVANFGGVRMDGSNATIIGDGLGNFIADRNGIARVWMDHAYWPLKTLLLYIHQSGDYEILKEKVPYFKDSIVHRGNLIDKKFETEGNHQYREDGKVYEGSIIEHLLVQNLCAFYEVGEHNTLKLRGADWNDALDMASHNGESVAFSYAYAGNLKDLAILIQEYAKNVGIDTISIASELNVLLDSQVRIYESVAEKTELLNNYCKLVEGDVSGKQISLPVSTLVAKLMEMSEWFTAHLNKQEWISGDEGQGWFNSYYDDSCRRVECYDIDDEKTRMMLTGQVFAIMGNVATDQQIEYISKAADRYLYREEIGGYRLNTDFHELKGDLGRMFGFAYGEKENGAVFSHMAVMYGNALYRRGFAKEGFKALNALSEASMNFNVSHMYPGIPEYFDAKGRGKYPYLTGAASWYLLTMITEVFGVKGEAGNLCLEPALLKEQFDEAGEAKISLNFADKRFDIVYANPSKFQHGTYKIKAASLNDGQLAFNDSKVTISRDVIDNLPKCNSIIVTLG